MSAPPVVDALDRDTFLERYLVPGRPLLVRGALADWPWAPPWSLATLRERFGHHRVLLYDTLFSPQGLSTFGSYLDRCTAVPTPDAEACADDELPYLRWYARQQADRLPWADRAFDELAGEWAAPGWLPDRGYLLPHRPTGADPTRQPFPAKGLFVCGRGGRTRLHLDPWASDACLCQVTGGKRFVMYSPATAAVAAGLGGDELAPHWRALTPDFDEVLEPGDAVYVPAGWHHWARALTDSVSITWNFVHEAHAGRFARHRAAAGEDPVLSWFDSRR